VSELRSNQVQFLRDTTESIAWKWCGDIDNRAGETKCFPPFKRSDRIGVQVAPLGMHREIEPGECASGFCKSFVERCHLFVKTRSIPPLDVQPICKTPGNTAESRSARPNDDWRARIRRWRNDGVGQTIVTAMKRNRFAAPEQSKNLKRFGDALCSLFLRSLFDPERFLLRFPSAAAEIAESLGRTVGSVKALQHRGLARLAEALADHPARQPIVAS